MKMENNKTLGEQLSTKFRQYKVQPLENMLDYEHNSRTHSKEQIQEIINSINEFGYTNPILVDENNGIIAGHCRVAACRQAGLTEIPTIICEGLTEVQKAALVIADNKLALNSGWDFTKLAHQISFLKENNFDTDLTGFKADEIATFMPDELPSFEGDEDAVGDPPADPITKRGDVWLLGKHRLMCGDSTMIDDVEKLFNKNVPLIMITDPPYGVKLDQSWRDDALGDKAMGKGNAKVIQNDDRADWLDAYSLFTGNIMYVWHATSFTDVVKNNIEDCGFDVRQQIIWNKSIMVMGRGAYHWKHEPCWYAVRKGCDANWQGDRTQTTVWDAESPNHIMSGSKDDKTSHPSQKPISIFEKPIVNHTKINDSVYDCFGGSGTTLIACEKTNRTCFMMELDPRYCDVIVSRWEKFTGKKAELEVAND